MNEWIRHVHVRLIVTGGTETWEEGIDPAAWTERQIKKPFWSSLLLCRVQGCQRMAGPSSLTSAWADSVSSEM